MKRIVPIVLLAAVLISSCKDVVVSSRPAVRFVEDVLSAPLSRHYLLVSDYDRKDVQGAVAVLGDSARCARISSLLLKADAFDNVDGKIASDGLPDFSGEVISSIADLEHSPYGALIASGDTLALREYTVRAFLESLDSLYSVGAYDVERLAVKLPAKLTVLASPEAEVYGKFDVDTLVRSVGKDFPVISPVRAMMRSVLESRPVASSVAILSDLDTLSLGVYQALMDEEASAEGYPRGTCYVFKADPTGGDPVLSDILDAYAASGGTAPLSAVIIDAGEVDTDLMKVSVDFVRNENSEMNLRYRQMLTRDFSFIVADDFYVSQTYSTLRERNIFTHNIAYPRAESYAIVRHSGENIETSEGSECTVIRYVQN